MGIRYFLAATRTDWIDAFQHVSGGSDLLFYASGFHDHPQVTGTRLEDIPDLGRSRGFNRVVGLAYFAMPSRQQPQVRIIHMNAGGIRYALDQEMNPDSFVICAGGVYDECCFVIGEISSLSSRGDAVQIAKRVASYARRNWHRGNGYWIGRECFSLYSGTHVFTDDCRIIKNQM